MNSTEQIKAAISNSQYEYISFDIFDTLVVRTLWEPSDLFVLLNDYYRLQCPEVRGKQFSTMRLHAEEETRRVAAKGNIPYQEITLDEIYRYLEVKHKIPWEDIEKLKGYEVDLELMHCRARESIKELYNFAIAKGKKIICISDMYLPREVLERILFKSGYISFASIFVSSEVRLTKHTGELYSYTLDKLGVEPEQVLHIGDNLVADKINAEKVGMHAVYYPKVKVAFTNALAGAGLNRCARQLELWCGAIPANRFMYARSVLASSANEYFDNPFNSLKQETNFYGHITKLYKLIDDSYTCPALQVKFWSMIQNSKRIFSKLVNFSRYALSDRETLVKKLKDKIYKK